MKIKLLASLVVGALGVAAQASPINYSMDVMFYGTIGGDWYGDLMTVSATGDSANVSEILPNTFAENDLTVSFTIGSTSGTFSDPLRFFVNRDVSVAGFSRNGISGLDIFDGYNAGLATFDYTADFDDDASYWYIDFTNAASTSAGDMMNVDSSIRHITIDVTPVPEPASMAALGLGVAAMARRRRKA